MFQRHGTGEQPTGTLGPVEVALAAGALVLATVALAVAVLAMRRRARPTMETGSGDQPVSALVSGPAATPAIDGAADARADPAGGGVTGPGGGRAGERRAERAELLVAVVDSMSRSLDPASVHDATGRALAHLLPGRWSEFLVVDEVRSNGAGSSDGALQAVARTVGPAGQLASCPVTRIDDCPAVRRTQPLLAVSSDQVDACRHLANRPTGACSAVCVPVGVAGRAVGVVHVLGPPGAPPEGADVSDVIWLAGHVGARLEALTAPPRAGGPQTPVGSVGAGAPAGDPVESHHEASWSPEAQGGALDLTDATLGSTPPVDVLTGLPGRAAFVRSVAELRATGPAFVLVFADVDDLGGLNHDAGHAAGDTAVTALASVLTDGLGPNSIAARLDGATFAVACPDVTLGRSVEAIEAVRSELLDAMLDGSAPAFTCSFGLTHSSVSGDDEELLRVARSGLQRAKDLGGDQIVYADLSLADEPPAG